MINYIWCVYFRKNKTHKNKNQKMRDFVVSLKLVIAYLMPKVLILPNNFSAVVLKLRDD